MARMFANKSYKTINKNENNSLIRFSNKKGYISEKGGLKFVRQSLPVIWTESIRLLQL